MPVRFSPAVESAIAEVCPPRDAFDAADFDAVEYLNSRFPDEASLAALPTFLNETRQRLRKNENELLKAVEAQAIGGPSSTSTDLATAKDAVAELNERVADIRAKASQSEETVQNLCQHIRDLDIAKTNLTASISTLRSIQLWMLQLQGLSTSFEKRRFIQCRDALLEAKKYSAMFEAMKDMPKVKELNDKQGQLCKQVEYYIRNTVFGNIAVDAMDEHTMAEACTVVDVMGTESIKKIRDRFIEKSLEGYTTRFKRGSDDAKLERTERRFVFIRTLLEQYDGIFKNVFPRHWCVPQELCVSFCIRTKQELDFHLRENSGSMDVVVLTYVLQKTIDVERDLTHMMAWPEEFTAKRDLPVYRYNGIILSAFKEHMGLFVQNEDKLMREALAQPLVGQAEAPCPGWASVEEEVRVGTSLPMAEDLFVFIKESLKRSLRIAQQEVLVEMAGVWRIHLIQYAAAVQGILPRPAITPIDIRRACIIINTADLCQTTSADLGAEVCARSDAPPSEVAFQTVVDAFSALYSRAVQNIVLGIEVAVAQPLYDYGNRYGGTGAKDGKGGAEEVGGVQDESPLIRAMTTTLHATVLLCAAVLPPQTLRFVLYKTAACIIPQFVHSLYRFRRVQEEAISSIRVDSAAFERTFLQLPTYNDPDRYDSATLSGYTKLVRREFDHLNRALKILQVDARDGTFVELYYDVTAPEDRSIQHFVRLVELKGLKRAQVRPWIAALSKRGVVESTKRDEAREAALGIATGNNAAVAAPGSNANNNNNNSGGGINFAALFSRDQTNASPSNTGNTGFSFTNFVNSIGHNNNNNGSK